MDLKIREIYLAKNKGEPILNRNSKIKLIKETEDAEADEIVESLIEQKELENDTQELEEYRDDPFSDKIKRFIEISKYFSSPLKKTASYMSENQLVSYPLRYSFEYKRGNITTQHIKFSNMTLEAVYIRLYKLIPDLEQLKFINLSMTRSKRIPPGLSYNLGFVYDDANEKPPNSSKMVFVASRKTVTPCYQICEIDLLVSAKEFKGK